MKLSMHMIKKWFEHYEQISTITNGSRTIDGVRIFEEDSRPLPNFLYIGKSSNFLPNGSENEILLMNKGDVIRIANQSVEKIFNEVLEAFDFYNRLEIRLTECAVENNPEQQIITACEKLVGPMFIMEKNFHILAISHNFSDVYVNEYWENYVNFHELRVENVPSLLDGPYLDLFYNKEYMKVFVEPTAAPYCYGVMNTYYSADGEIIGNFTLANNKPIEPYDLDIAEIVMNALMLIQKHSTTDRKREASYRAEEFLLLRLLSDENKEIVATYIRDLRQLPADSEFLMVCGHSENSSVILSMKAELSKAFIDSFVTIANSYVIMLVCSESKIDIDIIEARLKRYASKVPIHFGISNPCTELSDMHYFYDQAVSSIDNKKPVARFFDIALQQLMHSQSKDFSTHALHPAIREILEMDRLHNSEYLETLKLYLNCERSIKRTSAYLHIHRNTVLTRIEKLKEKELFNLENDYERVYLLISLLYTGANLFHPL